MRRVYGMKVVCITLGGLSASHVLLTLRGVGMGCQKSAEATLQFCNPDPKSFPFTPKIYETRF
jgi:hypothetical protein